MNTRQINAFITVAECGSFSKAGKILDVSPQSLMEQIGRLESELQVTLFERSSKGATLTPAGERAYQNALRIRELYGEMKSLGRCDTEGEIRVGQSSQPLMLLPIYEAYTEAHPEMHLNIVPLPPRYNTSVISVLDGTVDVSESHWLDADSAEDGVECTLLTTVAPICLMSLSHPLAGRERISPEDLNGLRLDVPPRLIDSDLCREIVQKAPECTVVKTDTDVSDVCDACYSGGCMLTPAGYESLFGPLAWSYLDVSWRYKFGLVHRPDPDERVQGFLEVAREVYA